MNYTASKRNRHGIVVNMDSSQQVTKGKQTAEFLQTLHVTEQPRDIFWLHRNLQNQTQNQTQKPFTIASAIGVEQADRILSKQHYDAIFIHCNLDAWCRIEPLPERLPLPDLLEAITRWSTTSAIIAIIHKGNNNKPKSDNNDVDAPNRHGRAVTKKACNNAKKTQKSAYKTLIEQLLHIGVDDYISAEDLATPILPKLLQYSVERKNAKQQLTINTLDPVTHLPGQQFFEHQLNQQLSNNGFNQSQAPNNSLQRNYFSDNQSRELTVVMAVQLDHIESIGATNEQATLHAYLYANGAKLQQALRQNDTVTCANESCFLILLNNMPTMDTVIKVSAHIIEVLGKAICIQGATLFSTASIGISIQTPKIETAKELIQQATQAANLAQQQGGNRHCLFSLDQRAQASINNQLTTELYKALQNNEFFLVFQPQMNAVTHELYGAEVLLRWQHPQHKTLSPYTFIPILESTGLITPVTEWIIHSAIKQWKQWREQKTTPLNSHLSINLSPSFLAQPTFKAFFNDLKNLPKNLKEQIHFEITENLFVDPDSNISHLKHIKNCGFKLSMDDFGTGYSSLSYLKHFPLDCIKLDCTFTKEIVENPTDLAITQAVINLSRDLNIDLIAEGVENEATLALLKHMGCKIIQGYHFSKPLNADDFKRYCQTLTTIKSA